MESYQRLISLYCNYPTKLIEETDGKLLLNAFGVDEPAKLLEVPGYLDAFTLVSECALVVDDFTERYPQPKKQVRESLRIMRQKLDEGAQPRKLETLRSLIEGRLRRKWPVGSSCIPSFSRDAEGRGEGSILS